MKQPIARSKDVAMPTRRSVLRSGAAIGAAAWLPAVLHGAGAPGDPIVRVRQGALRGTSDGVVQRFLGIPFARPPIGALRFLPPAPAQQWQGVRDALAFGDAPLQAFAPVSSIGAAISEDCLKLNVYAPAAPGPHPVFVWIHGGGNTSGAASGGFTDGSVFARSGIVCVTIGYRLGAAGFLELGDLLGPRYRGSGVNGLRDQIAALAWIRDNIAAFGGDPARVTVGGESAGGKNVVALLGSPRARGLFRQAIVESGGQTVHDQASAARVARLFVDTLAAEGLRPETLLTLDGPALIRLQGRAAAGFDRPFPFRPMIGTDVLPAAPLDAIAKGAGCDVALLIGTNRDESVAFLARTNATKPLRQADLANRDVADVLSVEAAYARAYPTLDAEHLRVRLITAEEYGLASFRVMEARRTCRAPTYAYRFDRALTGTLFTGYAPHTAELPFVWQSYDTPIARAMGGASPTAAAFGALVHDRWCRFIRGQAPWPRYDGRRIAILDQDIAAGTIDRAEYALWPADARR